MSCTDSLVQIIDSHLSQLVLAGLMLTHSVILDYPFIENQCL